MKKVLFFAAAAVCLLLSACGKKAQQLPTRPAMRFVVQVDVTYRKEDTALRWLYTDQKKMEAVLLYLRSLSPLGQTPVDPQEVAGEHYEIVLRYSDGGYMVYYQHADRYLSKDYKPFEQIDPRQAKQLQILLDYMSSDIL